MQTNEAQEATDSNRCRVHQGLGDELYKATSDAGDGQEDEDKAFNKGGGKGSLVGELQATEEGIVQQDGWDTNVESDL